MRDTPIRQQYLSIKQKYPGAIVLFRLGDFYETFDDDARLASRELEIVLTARQVSKGHRIPMAGIPYHALDNYLSKLITRGYKVAICEQMTRPGDSRGLVERDVVRVVTPGTVIEPNLLESKTNNFLLSLVVEREEAGLAYVDVSTGEFEATQLVLDRLPAELARLNPAEIVTGEGEGISGLTLPGTITRQDTYWSTLENARRTLMEHFEVATLDGYGCSGTPLAVRAAGALVHYLQETQKAGLKQLTSLGTYTVGKFMALDEQTKRNLELFEGSRGAAYGSLLSVLDLTRTAMGGRLLRRWLGQPLLDLRELNSRQDVIAWFAENTLARSQTIRLLGEIADLERLINRIRGGMALPRELISLRRSLETIPALITVVVDCLFFVEKLKPCPDVITLIQKSLEDEPAGSAGDGGVIKAGFSTELDKLRDTSSNTRRFLADLECRERERSGIKTLKIGYNRVFGYYIEVTQANLGQVPQDYIRKQTLTGGERFVTPELKEYESTILNAQERIAELETSLFQQVCRQVAASGDIIMDTAHTMANLDVVAAMAEAAVRYNYRRPMLVQDAETNIVQGRHPVVERNLTSGSFVPNDTYLATGHTQLVILTGPNMSGKSTYLRQVALITLMAQIGSFVPAASATIGITDRIFTRIGAGEDIASGQSTFMVEMVETANILNNATPCSLIILDEIGRGTSTYDGLSIARAVVEYIHNHPRLGSRTLFATHYHELVDMAHVLPRVKNFNVAVSEDGGKVVFLYRIVPGGADRSYGIHVAQLAGLPKPVIHRAGEILAELEKDGRVTVPHVKSHKTDVPSLQLSLLGQKSPVVAEIEALDVDSLTPLEALTKLYELKKEARES